MKVTLLFTAAILMIGRAALADDPKKDAPAPEQVLAMEEGAWEADVTVFPPGSEGKGFKSQGTETNTMLGKWLISDFKGVFGNQPFLGHGQYGFDAKKGKYVATWIDSMSTSMATMEGTYDAATKTLTFTADIEDPHTGKPMKTKMVTVFKEGSRVFSEWAKPEGASEFIKMMEISYKKKAK